MPFIELVAQRRSPTPPPGMQPPENAKDWFRIENSAEDVESTDVYVYDSIGGWFGMYADEFIEALGEITTSKINLRLNSPGGSVFEGIAIANAIRSHPANVTVYVDSLAASIASVIALAGDRVVMMPQAQFMIHNASGAEYGQAADLRKTADLLDKQSLNIAQAYAQHTGRPLAEWQALMEAETWFTAEEAVEMGLADELIPMRPAKEAPASNRTPVDVMNRTWDLTMYRYAGRANAPAPVTNTAPEAEPVTEAPAAESAPETIASMTRDDLVALIRDVVTTAMAPIEEGNDPSPPPPPGTPETPQPDPGPAPEPEPENSFPPPDEDEEETSEPEDANSEDPDEESEPEAAKKKLPPFLQPDEEEEEDDPEDAWSGLVARLTAPSPSADDVFMSLKEAW